MDFFSGFVFVSLSLISGWKSGIIENWERIEKWKNRSIIFFLFGCKEKKRNGLKTLFVEIYSTREKKTRVRVSK